MAHSKRIRVLTGYDANDNPTYVQVSGKTQNDINDAIVRAYVESDRIWEFIPKPETAAFSPAATVPVVAHARKTSFSTYAQGWFDSFIQSAVSVGRAKTLQSQVNKCCEAFPNMFIEDITVRDIARVMDQWGKHYARNTVDNMKVTLKRIFDSAVQDKLMDMNPVADKRIRNTAPRSKKTTCLSVEQVTEILNNLQNLQTLQQQTIIALYLFTGVRREELLGLKWEDVNFSKSTIHVERAVVYYKGTSIKDPKTPESIRDIPLCSELLDLLMNHERKTGYIISADGTAPLPLRAYEKEMEKIRKQINLYGAHSREFRRTFATLEIAAGVPIPVIQAKMGHTKATQTLNSYAKVERRSWEESRNAIPDLIAAQNVTKTATAAP